MTLALARGIAAGVDYGKRTFLDFFRSSDDELEDSEHIGGKLITVMLFPYMGEKIPTVYGVRGMHALLVVPGIENKCWVGGQPGYAIASRDSVDELAEAFKDAVQSGGIGAEIVQLPSEDLSEIVSINHTMLDQPEIAVVTYDLLFPDDKEYVRDVFDSAVVGAAEKIGIEFPLVPLEA